ncbi:MAG: hypothetical protein K2K42_00680, partial [Eubacterium sp.]|nr:hypothetical protein [Eubacterium sp.]
MINIINKEQSILLYILHKYLLGYFYNKTSNKMKKAAEGTTAFSKGVKIYVKAKGFSTKRLFALLPLLYPYAEKSQYSCA